MTDATLQLLRTRRSSKPDLLIAPGPDARQVDELLTIAARVPDHKKLVPWRFIVFEGEARARFGEVMARVCAEEEKEPPSDVRLDFERQRFLRAPLVIAVVSRVVETKGAPEWEQILSAGASAMTLCIAANAMGFATCWLTEWVAYSPRIGSELRLAANERIVGFVYIGTASVKPDERPRPALADVVTRWGEG